MSGSHEKFNYTAIALSLKSDQTKSVPFYVIRDQSGAKATFNLGVQLFTSAASAVSTGYANNGLHYWRSHKSPYVFIIKHEIIDYLTEKQIICTSVVENTIFLFKFKKNDDKNKNKNISTSRMIQSNWYAIDILWTSDTKPVTRDRSFAVLDRGRKDLVDKNDLDFWFNFKPYYDESIFTTIQVNHIKAVIQDYKIPRLTKAPVLVDYNDTSHE